MVVQETERDRWSEGRINGKVEERWIERKVGCRGWERQIDKGKGREKLILWQEYAPPEDKVPGMRG